MDEQMSNGEVGSGEIGSEEVGSEEVMEIDGYLFHGKADYDRAIKEKDTIEKLKDGMSPEDFDGIKRVYEKLTAKNYFSTPVGINFLHEMQAYLIENGEQVAMVPVPKVRTWKSKEEQEADDSEEVKTLRGEVEHLKSVRFKLAVAVIALVVTVLVMIFMVLTNDNSGYFRAEEKVLNKYSAWEEELTAREQAVSEREDALTEDNNMENQ